MTKSKGDFMMWQMWKKGFDQWEATTAKYLEEVIRNPAVLKASGDMLNGSMKTKAQTEKFMSQWWSMMGLPTRTDQERTLHALNQLQSRILDLEEKLEARGE
ncbi:hypothetical protein FRD01_09025 [Microvenator marinus]|jgi:hypothetical protein|uniref:Poly(3-hydroxyalkanoate) polymerase subunit PhaE n=2 Tax=Microvenator marinus TaxID=2600177 RepID=A0A5B8XQW4_9DELT|nr:hypothetical protein FRD01_09025 [Microvenator marinus]